MINKKTKNQMNKYVVIRNKGYWDDHQSYPVAIFDTESDAKDYVKKKNEQIERIKELAYELYSDDDKYQLGEHQYLGIPYFLNKSFEDKITIKRD
jgi:hypothetical protein